MLQRGILPVRSSRPHRATGKTTTAIRTDVIQYVFNATSAKGTFIAADAGFGGAGWQVFIAGFAVGSQF